MSIFKKLFDNKNSDGLMNLTDELKGIYIKNKFDENNKNILLVTSSLYEANLFYQILSKYEKDVLLFPMDDFLTSEALAESPELKTTRLETLKELNKPNIVITNLMGYLRYLPNPNLFKDSQITLEKGKEYNIHDLVERLMNYGYTKEVIVNKTGEIAVRGFVIDIFPINESNPIRIEFWGDEVDSIRIFDIDTQLTIKEIDDITINPNTEFITKENIDRFNLKHREITKYGETFSILDYLNNPIVFFNDYDAIENSYKLLVEEMFNYSISIELPGDTKYMNDLEKIVPKEKHYFLNFDNITKYAKTVENYNSSELNLYNNSLKEIEEQIVSYIKNKKTVIICLNNRYQANKIIDEFTYKDIILTNENEIFEGKINIIIKSITKGFILKEYVFISENDIFGKKNTANYKTNFKLGKKIRDINKLEIGDYVVHNTHGIGRYLGIRTLTKNNLKKDYLHIEYKDGDKLYIPVEKIELITKFSSKDGIVPKINKLGSIEWEKTKLKAKKRIENIAGELLKLYAEREASEGYSFSEDTQEQIDFEKEFVYKETSDQLRVTEEIKKDMESSHPMDRLLCGDVGYGKTEVAFRAIFKAILSGKQVALLCPTTILSNQHFQNALERFKSFPVNIAILNRFVSKKETNKTIEKLKEGKIDLLIGTHRILSDDIEFKDLGLLIVDEEQRFGVKHKEKIKQYKNNIDILTLSATPIPRTLQMSMSGVRSLSLIETPPVNRYPIQTYVLAYNKQIIKDAIYKELSRDGQVFILHNKVEDIETFTKELNALVPNAKFIYAHGQMTKTELENKMLDFTNHEYDVMVCTTIIETGIDIPNVNTLIIDDADHFGLSQLYQIRGRVGRSNKIAHCYLMYNPAKTLNEIAVKRLKAIKDFTELGSGFAIAMRDLSIRGAGDILGSEQAGFIDTIGIELFLEMLNNEIKILKGEKVEEKNISPMPLLDVETSIDDNYVPDEELKIEIHKKINEIDSYEKLYTVKNEIEDRFGKLSEELIIYMYEEWFEKLANDLKINQVKQTKNFIEIVLDKEQTKKVDGQLLFLEATRISRMFRFKLRGDSLVITLDTVKLDKHFVYYLIELMEVLEKAIK